MRNEQRESESCVRWGGIETKWTRRKTQTEVSLVRTRWGGKARHTYHETKRTTHIACSNVSLCLLDGDRLLALLVPRAGDDLDRRPPAGRVVAVAVVLGVLEPPEPGQVADRAVVTRGGGRTAAAGETARAEVGLAWAERSGRGRERVGDGRGHNTGDHRRRDERADGGDGAAARAHGLRAL